MAKPKRDKILSEAMYGLLCKLNKSERELLLKPSLEKMMRGDISTLKEWLDRIEGKVANQITGENEGPIQLVVKWGKED